MDAVAYAVLLVMIPLTVWALLKKAAVQLPNQLLAIWAAGRWGKQILVDFYALEAMLALWMVSHAMEHGSWAVLVPCLATMPMLGAISAALYWLLAVA